MILRFFDHRRDCGVCGILATLAHARIRSPLTVLHLDLHFAIRRQKASPMSSYLFVCYPRCSTCRKARQWLDDQGVSYEARDIAEDNPTVDELKAWHQASGLPIRRFFNTSGRKYRELNVKAQLDAGLSDDDCYRLLSTDGLLVKRPILVERNAAHPTVLVGFKEPEWQRALLDR